MSSAKKNGFPKTTYLLLIIITAAISAAVSAYVTYSVSSSTKSESEGNYSYLELTSLTAKNVVNNEVIGKIENNMVLNKDQPIFIVANFSNPNSVARDYIVTFILKNGTGYTEEISVLRGSIGGMQDIALDTYWEPHAVGTYSMQIFLQKPEDLNRTDQPMEIANKTIKVVGS
jgi:hypothetical protein